MIPIDVHNIYNQTIILLYAYLNGKIQKLYEVGVGHFKT